MFFVTVFGFFLRLIGIIKPEGLWNDEYVSWMTASVPFGQGFWEAVLKQCHMPLYYLYLKPFVHCSDMILRLTSVIPSVAAIIVMYFVGKEYSKKIGIFAASITSVLSFLVYYAQEVRFYSLVFLFSAILLFFTIRLIKTVNKQNILGYIISAILIIFTHNLGIIYVFFNTAYVVFKKKLFSKKLCIITFLILITVVFWGINILHHLPSSQWWGKFSYTNILFMFSDFFSPILTNHINAPPVFFYNIRLAIWMTVPTVIAIAGIVLGLRQNKGLFFVSLMTTVVLSLLALSGIIVFLTKYAIEILPALIVIMCLGFNIINKFGTILFALLISFHISAIFTPYYTAKMFRPEGNRIVGEIINLRKPDKIIYTYYSPDRFARYVKINSKDYHISKINRHNYRGNPKRILDNVNSGETVSVVFLDSVSFFPEKYIEQFGQNLPEMFVTFSHVKNELISELDKNYTDFQPDKLGSWTVITAKKK